MKKRRSVVILTIALLVSLSLLAQVSAAEKPVRGDLNDSGTVNEEDVLYLLRHTLFPDRYPLNQAGDMDGNGAVDSGDPIYLLWHALMPDRFPLECEVHTAVTVPAVEPTCGSSGLTEGSRCSECGKVLTAQEYVAPLGHSVTGGTRVEPTCTEPGYTQSRCALCGEEVAQEILYATGHSFGSYTTVRAATCTQTGTQERTCLTCGEKETVQTGALGHSYALMEDGSYVCGGCGDTVTQNGDGGVSTDGEYVTDCPVDYGFMITTGGDEAYIRENLKIVDVTYDGTSQEKEGVHDYILTPQPDGSWLVTPSPAYEENTTYIARLEGDLEFTDHMGDTLTFRIIGENGAVYRFSDKLIFIRLPEQGDPRRDAYRMDLPEDSDLIYLTLPEQGIFTEEYVSRVVCVGDYESMEELQADPSKEAAFGKIAQVLPQADGSCLLVLECPQLEEVYDDLDVVYSGPVEMLDPETVREVEEQAVAAVYASEGFADFLTSAMIASEDYAREHGLTVDGSISATLLDKITITVKSSYRDEKLNVGVSAILSVPLKDSNGGEYGTLKFALDVSLAFKIKVTAECRLWKILWRPVGVRSFLFEVDSETEFKFVFGVTLEIEKDWGTADSELYKSGNGMIHRHGCSVIEQDVALQPVTPAQVNDAYRAYMANAAMLECAVCRPISGYLNDNYFFINHDSGTAHRFCCSALDRYAPNCTSGYVTKELPGTYKFCSTCNPQVHQNLPLNFDSYLKAAMKYKDWAKLREETKEHLDRQKLGNGKNSNIDAIDIPIVISVFEIHLDVDIVLELKFEGTINYEYSHSSRNISGIRLNKDYKLEAYKHNEAGGESHALSVMGKVTAKLGVKVNARASLTGWDRFINIGISAEAGLYAELTGVLRIGAENMDGSWDTFCYGTAYLECGLYTDVYFQYKVVCFNGKLSLLGGEKRLPIFALGYDRVYYNYTHVPELVTVTGNSVDLSSLGILNSRYYSARKDETGDETLNIAGVPGKYEVSVSLLDENGQTPAYAAVSNGVLTLAEDAPCGAVLTATVSVEGKEKMVATVTDFLRCNFKSGSSRYDLPDYRFKMQIDNHKIGEWETLVEPTCTEEGVRVRYYLCDCVDEEGNPKEYVRESIPALGHAPVTDEAVQMTCTRDGWTEGSHCERCELVFVEQILIPARGHSYTDVFTCHDRPCLYTDCDHVELATTDHRWTEWMEMEAGGCSETSFRIHSCVDCRYIEDEKGSQGAVTHHDPYFEIQLQPTCEEQGHYLIKCTRCDWSQEEWPAATGHNMSKHYLSDADTHYQGCLNPNCTYKTETKPHVYDNSCDSDCNVCGRERPIAHIWKEGYEANSTSHWKVCRICGETDHRFDHRGGTPSCGKQALCRDCGKPYGEAGRHDYSVESLNYPREAASCEKAATYYYACSLCGGSSEKEGTWFAHGDPLGHDWSEEFIPVEGLDQHQKPCLRSGCKEILAVEDCRGGTASCQARAVCEVCHDPYGTKGHQFTVQTQDYPKDAATCEKAATYYYSCALCGESSQTEDGKFFSHGDPLGHDWSEEFLPVAGKDQHHKPCLRSGCKEILAVEDCRGGTATCQAQAVCEVCHGPYGKKAHEFTAQTLDYPRDAATCEAAATYYYACVFCGESSQTEDGKYFSHGDPLGHDWSEVFLPVAGKDQHHKPCLRSGCTESDQTEDCRGGTATCKVQAVCEVCHDPYGPKAHDFSAESLNYPKAEANCEEAATYYYACVFCGESSEKTGNGEFFSYGDSLGHSWEEVWTPGEKQHWHKCANCDKSKGDEQNHYGGTGTCLERPVCEACGEAYGDPAQGHKGEGTPIPAEDGITHYQLCARCGQPCNTQKHTPKKEATCQERKLCSGCGVHYGELGDHRAAEVREAAYLRTAADCENDATYWKSCSVCKEALDEYFTAYGTKGHIGGTATCKEQAVCERCKEPYGDLAAHEEKAVHDDLYHWTECAVCGQTVGEKAEHAYDNECDATCGETDCGYVRIPPHKWMDKPVSEDGVDVHWIRCRNCTEKKEGSESPCYGGTPSCTEPAECEACETKYGPTLPHGYSLQLEKEDACKQAPTCTDEGIYYLSCVTCDAPSMDDAYTFSVPALGHDHSEEYTKCGDDENYHHRVCRRVNGGEPCTDTVDREKCFGGQATCNDRPVCTKCGEEYGQSLGGCDFSIEDVSDEKKVPGQKDVGCEGPYEYYKTCSRCGEVSNKQEDIFTALTGKTHHYPEGYSQKEGDKQFHYRECTDCAFGTQAQPHDYSEYAVTEPTCKEAGKKERTCKVCEYLDSEPLDQLPHSYEEEYCVLTEGPVKSEISGEMVYRHKVVRKCVNYDTLGCGGYLELSEYIEHAHEHVGTRNEVPATCTETGLTPEIYCDVEGCGAVLKEQEVIPALGHDYVDYVCTRCGDVDVDGSHWLDYRLSEDESFYILTGRGSCTDEEIVVPPSYKGLPVTQVSDNAFYGDTFGEDQSVTAVTFPAGIRKIGAFAFSGCAKLTTVAFSTDAALEELGDYAFSGTALTGVRIPAGVNRIGYGVFAECARLAQITVDPDNEAYCAVYSVIYSKDKTAVVCYPGGKTDTELVLESTVTRIEDFAIRGAAYLTKAELPAGVTYVGDGAFQNCTALQELHVPVTVTNIGSFALGNCESLQYIYYEGTFSQWQQVSLGEEWDATGTDYQLICLGDPLGSQGLEYTLSTDGTYYIVSGIGTCTDTEIVIPVSYQGKLVKAIGSSAFRDCTSLTSIMIPEGVTSIGNRAFERCTSLTSVMIPEGVTSIGDYVFGRCSNLTSIVLSEGLNRIGDGAFYICSNLTSIVLPESVAKIGNSAFYGCGSLTSVVIPEGITSIGKELFYDCSSLTSIVIPEGVTSIGHSAFYRCSSLTSIVLPEGVTSIGSSAFSYCIKLTGIVIPEGVTSIGESAFWNCSSLTSAVIPESVTQIGNSAFRDCGSLTSIVIPKGITTIGELTFYNCSSLASITIPKGVISIGNGAFSWCDNLHDVYIEDILAWCKITFISQNSNPLCNGSKLHCNGKIVDDLLIPAEVAIINNYTFSGCSSLTNVTIPEDVTSIGDYAFYNCSSLTNITIPEGVTRIGSGAFQGCSSLVNIRIPDSVTSIGNYVFASCSGLESITIPEGITSIGENAFQSCSSLTSIVMPESVTSIGESAFLMCGKLLSITIPKGVTSIGESAFAYCTNLKEIIYPGTTEQWNAITKGTYWDLNCSYTLICLGDSQESPGSQGLEYTLSTDGTYYIVSGIGTCTDTEIVIPSTHEGLPVKEIGYRAFYNCSSITSIVIPEGVTSIGDYVFERCSNLTSIVIPEGVTRIGSWVFYRCSSLTSIAIPENVTRIGEYAFNFCSSLTSIVLPESVTSIGESAFRACSSLTSIVIPEGVTSIGESAFSGCTSLCGVYIDDVSAWCEITFESADANPLYCGHNLYCNGELVENLVIPKGTTSIGTCAFYNCSSITSIVIPEGVTSIGSSAFSYCSKLTGIVIPEGVTSIGDSAFRNCSSLTSAVIPESVTQIGNSAFQSCSNLTSIVLPEGITSIGNQAFESCTSLTSVVIPESVASIGNRAFYGCGSLTSIVIPESVTSIGNGAFYRCHPEKIHYNSVAVEDKAERNNVFSFAAQNGDGIKLIIGSKVERIPDNLFNPSNSADRAPNIVSIEFEEGSVCKEIGEQAFAYCTNLKEIIYPGTTEQWNAMTKDTDWDLECVYTLTCLGDPQGSQGLEYTLSTDGTYYIVSGIGTCTDTEIVIPGTYEGLPVKEIGDYAFESCNTIVSVALPDDIITLGNFAFRYCSAMTSINLPEGLTSIGSYALGNCTGLKSVELPESMKHITQRAFYSCSGLQNITIPDSITDIGTAAFEGCSSLKSITIPENVTSIGKNAFNGCTALEEIFYNAIEAENLTSTNYTFGNAGRSGEGIILIIGAKVEKIPDYLFEPYSTYYADYIPNIVTVKFEENSVCTTIGMNAFGRCKMLKEISLPDSITTIEHGAFSSCAALTSITLPKNLAVLSDSIFQYCSNLVEVTIPKGVSEIQGSVFHGCQKLTSITIPEGVTMIRSYAFQDCTSLTSITLPVSLIRLANGVFRGCTGLETICYKGTSAQWSAVEKDSTWDQDCTYTLVCMGDG